MLQNYFAIIWRNLLRNKLFSFIHILGLSLGIACALFLAIIVMYEYKWDGFHEKIDNIYILRKTLFMETGAYTVDN
nr:hypothetical protein [Bacteroidota bacterium]